MKLLIELEVQDKNIPIWSYSTGLIRYDSRTLEECKKYVRFFLENRLGIKILKIKKGD